MNQSRCAIALGANLGDPEATLEAAIKTLDQTPQIRVEQCSSWYLTKAIGPPQPDYINGCAILQTSLTPPQLMQTLLEVENQFGRIRRERWGARTLDLDLLLFDDVVLESPDLIIPHPRMGDRAFVLIPLAEIAAHWIDPISQFAIATLVEQVDTTGVRQAHPTA
ncbi:2-amino-4-hydroxy-6-hydroxymethyldihydropteridine diphosphokinase [filamentous cyanobacterium LEGE 11480]|uniref:2-amino-4-hydroxy-6-hydroxymethyldihydropteridine diphosphokinase n=1 Tax=Romeriopsis navalis LEGE 11480 TaxID=2777977 RepID=A0A928VLG8_9CYAN|nr:2-amino-4-hydroxy-6-hydroxymethyldihydropteridine diphosphokinase [Romeriopsis navalis]MBE9028796.1 2-amino-4-hydroxy-6-hydroxymethyldihydropteridine diphosphokinase [Romeriopsis navalis LEGE 11480]